MDSLTLSQEKVNPQTNPWTAKVKVLAIHPSNRLGNIRAYATIQISNALEIHSIKVIAQPGQKAYVRLPESEQGSKYYPVVKSLDTRLTEAIATAVLEAWRGAQ